MMEGVEVFHRKHGFTVNLFGAKGEQFIAPTLGNQGFRLGGPGGSTEKAMLPRL
jgi:hypothetical protein